LHTVAFDEANTQAFLHYIKNLPRHNDFALRLYRCKFPGEWTGTKCVLEDLLEPESAPCLQSLECARCSALVTIVQKSSTLSKLILCVNYIPLALDVIPYLALLKQLTHLTLKFEHEDAENEPALLAALFRNGSLHEIVVTHAKGCGHIPEEKLWAVGQRNKVGPTLLHDCLATTAVTDATTSDDRGDSESDEAVVLAADSAPIATSADAPAKPAVSLAPSLVVVTTQAPLLAFKRVWNAMAKWNPSEQKNATNRGKKRTRASLKAD
jgi:hypothetical protein